MSSQKDKFLASAQKFIQKGQFDRALRDYEQVVNADPKDVKLRQKLAELMIRCNRREDAIREYSTIARFYDENGFYLKSIAVYKQIQRLDPSNIEISLCLGALNEKQGMIGNALSEYKMVYDHYQKQGLIDQAIEILQKMQAVDPENVDIRLKLAETYFAAKSEEKAYQEFTRVAITLKNRGNDDFFERVNRKIHELFPDKTDSSALDILREQLRNGTPGYAVPKLQQILQSTPDNFEALGLLSEAYRLSGEAENREAVLRQMVELAPNDISAKKSLILCRVEAGDLEGSVALLGCYSTALFSAGAYGDVERYYTVLQNLAPYDLRLLEGLKNLYELTGESSKLADVQVSLNILSQKEVSKSSRQVADAVQETPDVSADDTGDSPWGEEIDLALTDVADSDSGEGPAPVDSMDFGSIELSTDDVTREESNQEVFEIDISFELPDEGAVFAPETGIPALDTELSACPEMEEVLAVEVDDVSAFQVPDVSLDDSYRFDEPFAPSPQEESTDAFEFSLEEAVLPLTEIVPDQPQVPFFEDPEMLPPVADIPPAESRSPDDVFARFKDVPNQDFEQDDTETHYNLGIAYMEMGLHEEAIKEFRIAANDPARKLDSLTLQGLCFREQARFAEAEELFTALLSLDSLDPDRVLALRYELGLLYEAAGRREESLQVFREIFGTNPGFRDTMQKIAHLSGKERSFDLSDLDDVDIELEELV
ncbi:MAG: tetratricopeptide repeat protein [Geobacteraceae bacterium]